VQRLRELGWIEGQTINIEYQWAQGSRELAEKIAVEFVRRKVDIIVTSATPPTTAAKQATSVIPIVFAAVGDPVGTGLVASLARPGGNATGLSLQQTDAAGKRLELLREAIPGIRRLAILANGGNLSALLDMREAQAMAQTAGFEAVSSEIRDPEDIAPAINAFRSRVEALYVCNDPLVATSEVRISAAAVEVRLPTMFGVREYVEVGGLMSFGPSFPDLYRRTADYVDKILRGAKPSDLPVEQPTKFELVINLKTAKALGLTVPPTLLARADEVIE
jgi:putative ABC transport system substrate-binding protein